MNLSEVDAQELVTTLQQKRGAGTDDLELITWLSNRYRIPKAQSRELYDAFYRGFQHGADSVIPVIEGKVAEPAAPVSGGTVYCAAYLVGQRSFSEEYAKSLERHRPRGCLHVVGFGLMLVVAMSAFAIA